MIKIFISIGILIVLIAAAATYLRFAKVKENYETYLKEKCDKEFEKEKAKLQADLSAARHTIEEEKKLLRDDFEEYKKQIDENKNYYKKAIDSEISRINDTLVYRKQNFEKEFDTKAMDIMHEISDSYNETLGDLMVILNDQIEGKNKEIEQINNELSEFKQRQAAYNEGIRKAEEIRLAEDAHRIILSEDAKEDIQYLLSLQNKINNKVILKKLIWSEYLQKPFNQMIHGLFGAKIPKCVIYLIEDKKSGKRYIGKTQSEVNKRWTEHIKSSLGIGTISSQLIHNAMLGEWDNFLFTVLEVTDKEHITEREKYWISFYESDKFGFNLKIG